MKKINLLLILLVLVSAVYAQVPDAINYQAVARNSSGQALSNQNIKVRLSLLRGATTLYSETRNVTTNALGLFNVQIGSSGATATTGDFTTIYWLNNTPAITLKVELDVNNSGVFTEMGNQSLATVPYAYAAKTSIDAVNLGGRYIDPTIAPNNGDVIKWSKANNQWEPAAAGNKSYILDGWPGSIPGGGLSAQWVFVGSIAGSTFPTQTITLSEGQSLIASVNIIFGSSSAIANNNISLSLCYKNTSAGSVKPNRPATYSSYSFTAGEMRNLSVHGTIKCVANPDASKGEVAPGTYQIGVGVKNQSTTALNLGEMFNGYIMVF